MKAEYLLCGLCIQHKKQFKVQIIGILEEIHSFYLPNMHFLGAKNFWQGPPPSFGKNSKRTVAFFRDPINMIKRLSRHQREAPTDLHD